MFAFTVATNRKAGNKLQLDLGTVNPPTAAFIVEGTAEINDAVDVTQENPSMSTGVGGAPFEPGNSREGTTAAVAVECTAIAIASGFRSSTARRRAHSRRPSVGGAIELIVENRS